jgi:hypothetical protein
LGSGFIHQPWLSSSRPSARAGLEKLGFLYGTVGSPIPGRVEISRKHVEVGGSRLGNCFQLKRLSLDALVPKPPAVGTPGVQKRSVAMAKIESILAEVGELLAVLAVKLESASIEEMPAMIDDAKQTTRLVITRCLASDVVSELPPKEAEMLRVELTKLGEALEAQIAGIVEVRLEQLTGGSASLTRH